jgi:hypothetical protein
MLEFNNFNGMWDAKMNAFEQNAEMLMQAMRVSLLCGDAWEDLDGGIAARCDEVRRSGRVAQRYSSLTPSPLSPLSPPLPPPPQDRHADELRDFQQKLIAHSVQPRHSREYYNLRDIQAKLASTKNYAGAAKMKEKADELMA